jgi:hypothetical protein
MVRCENCVNKLTRGHESGACACWALPDKGKLQLDVERDCKMHDDGKNKLQVNHKRS